MTDIFLSIYCPHGGKAIKLPCGGVVMLKSKSDIDSLTHVTVKLSGCTNELLTFFANRSLRSKKQEAMVQFSKALKSKVLYLNEISESAYKSSYVTLTLDENENDNLDKFVVFFRNKHAVSFKKSEVVERLIWTQMNDLKTNSI